MHDRDGIGVKPPPARQMVEQNEWFRSPASWMVVGFTGIMGVRAELTAL